MIFISFKKWITILFDVNTLHLSLLQISEKFSEDLHKISNFINRIVSTLV